MNIGLSCLETLPGTLAALLTVDQRGLGFSEEEQPNNVYGEIYRDSLQAPDEGLQIRYFNA